MSDQAPFAVRQRAWESVFEAYKAATGKEPLDDWYAYEAWVTETVTGRAQAGRVLDVCDPEWRQRSFPDETC